MPLPNVQQDEQEAEYMGRCVSFIKDADDTIAQEQAIEMCSIEFKKAQGEDVQTVVESNGVDSSIKPAPKMKSKIEILSEMKKLIEKNNLNIDENDLIAIFEKMNDKGTVKQFSLSAELNPEVKRQTIKVFPMKSVFIEKYKEKIDFNDKLFDEMIDSFENAKLFKPFVDEQHQLGIKFAEIKRLFKTPDGLFADLELNSLGLDAVKNNKYSYISPEWGTRVDTDGIKHENVLWAITLTNIPALEGENPTLQEQIKLEKNGGKRMDYKTKLEVLRSRVSLNKKLEGEPVDPAIIMEALDMIKEVLAKLEEATGAQAVAEEVAQEMTEKFTALDNEIQLSKMESYFQEKVSLGQLEPSEKELWESHFKGNEEFVRKILDAKPKKEDGQKTLSLGKKNDNGLDDEDRFIMKSLSKALDPNKPEDVAFYLKNVKEAV